MRLWWGHLSELVRWFLMDAILVTGKEDARCEGETSGGKDKVEWEVRDEGYGASRLVVQHHRSTHQVSPFWWFYGHFNTTHPNSAIDSLWLTHSLEAVPHSSSSQVIGSSHLSIFYPNFPMMSHCVSFYYTFSFDLSSDSSCCSERNFLEFSSDSLMSNHLLISEMLLSHSAFPSCI